MDILQIPNCVVKDEFAKTFSIKLSFCDKTGWKNCTFLSFVSHYACL